MNGAPAETGPVAPPAGGGRARDLLLAFSFANLCLLTATFTLLYDSDQGYYNKLRVTPVILAALVANLAWLTGLFWAGGTWARRSRSRWVRIVGHVAMGLVWLVPADFVRFNLLQVGDQRVAAFLLRPAGILVVVVGLLVMARWHRIVARASAALGLILAPFGVFTLARVLLILLGVTTVRQHTAAPAASPPLLIPPSERRVVWIIFDETDQRLLFEARKPGIELPEIDRLRSTAFTATNAYPPGGHTLVSMPALVSRLPVVQAKPASASELALRVEGVTNDVPWSVTTNVFTRARALGYNTALIGWFHPYGRLLGTALTVCEWFAYPQYEPTGATAFLPAMGRQLWAAASPFNRRMRHIELHHEILKGALQVVSDPKLSLVLLHFSIPHQPAIYRAAEDRFTWTGVRQPGGYFQSLVLADRTLTQLRQALEANGLAERTWLIVSSDHWWRNAFLVDGRTDARIPFLIKPPGESVGQDYGEAFDTVLTADLILAVLRGEVKTVPEVAAWVEQHRQPPRPEVLNRTAATEEG